MFCPQCGQERLSTETSFCSRCGFLLTGAAELLLTGGLIPRPETLVKAKKQSPRTKGIKQGFFMLLSAILIVPLLTIIAIGIRMNSPILPLIGLITIVGGSILRMAYAALFESPEVEGSVVEPTAFSPSRPVAALPSQQSIPVSTYAAPKQGSWRDTNDLEPASITENTTRLLESEDQINNR